MNLFEAITRWGKSKVEEGKRKREAEHERENNIRDVSTFEDNEEAIKRFLEFQELSGVFNIWCEYQDERCNNERAEVVMSSIFQQRKILDTLRTAISFTENLDDNDDVHAIPEIFVNQCLYFIRKNVDDMNEKYSAVKNSEPLDRASVWNKLRFIREECISVPSIKDLPLAYEAVERLRGKLSEKTRTSQQKSDISKVSSCVEFLQNFHKDIPEVQNIKRELEQKLSRIRANISKGEELYELVNSRMSPEWFNEFSPLKLSRFATIDDLKKFYHERLNFILNSLSLKEE